MDRSGTDRSSMYRRWFGFTVVAALLVSGLSCARNQHLLSLQIQPSGATFGAGDSSLFVDFKAYGTFEHPPQTKDLTNQVTWISDTPQVATVTSAGVVNPVDNDCGSANVSATFQDGDNLVVSNAAQITVNGPAADGCTPAGPQPILQVSFAGAGLGTVTSAPAGITCNAPSSCSATFTTGQTVTLTAAAGVGSTFQGWTGCSTALGSQCTVVMENNVAVIANFSSP
jgi:Divergent InlB B-repeat domain